MADVVDNRNRAASIRHQCISDRLTEAVKPLLGSMKSFSDAIISLTPFHPSLTHQMQDQIFDSRQDGSASDDMAAPRFQCPFPECTKYYKRNSDVRKHVRRKHPTYQACQIRGCQVYSPKGDKRHLADHQFVQGTTIYV